MVKTTEVMAKMANLKVSLIRICKTDKGWRRYPAAIGRNGKIRPGYAVVGGEQLHYPDGHYELRLYKGSKPYYKNVGEDAQDALSALNREAHLQAVRVSAKAAGIEVAAADVASTRLRLSAKKDEFVKRLVSMGHQRASETFLVAFNDFSEAVPVYYADELKEDHILQLYRHLRKKGNQDRTIYNKHASLFGFFKWMKVDTKALAAKNPTYTEREVEEYDAADLKALLKACDEYQKVVFETFLKTGMRMQEGMFLEWQNLDFRGKKVKVRERLDSDLPNVSIKDRAERSIPLPDDLAQLLTKWKAKRPGTRLVLGTENDTPNWKMLRMLKRTAKRAGLSCGHCAGCRGTGECYKWKIKTFRSTYTTKMLRSGVDPRTLMEWTGHEDLATIMKYLAASKHPEMQKMVSKIKWT